MEKIQTAKLKHQQSSHRVSHSIVSADFSKSYQQPEFVKFMADGELLVGFEDEPVS